MQNEYPSLSERIQSILIDQVFIIMLMYFFSLILDRYENIPDWIRITLFVALWAAYEPFSMTFGCTLGNYIKGIRARKFSDTAKRINIFQAYIRYILKVLLGWIAFLTVTSNKDRRAIHDLAASTVMIKV
jgi:uncharacterized RDD family membrane protein YckC